MAKGNRVVLTPDRGYPVEGFLASGETVYPGMLMQVDATVASQGGRFAWKIYNPGSGADGGMPTGPFIILTEDILQGKTMTDAYGTANTTRLFGFVPLAGCELNLKLRDVAGTGTTGDNAGTVLIPKATFGTFIPTTGTPICKPALQLEEASNDWCWCMWSGY